jgi:hypothetical protein
LIQFVPNRASSDRANEFAASCGGRWAQIRGMANFVCRLIKARKQNFDWNAK